ncbi:peptidase family M48-domain-containing protein [Phlyctochytrium arcticum]|nr:peptidase family M48-domain-containing protein [Phlyctochytrium arcticum]
MGKPRILCLGLSHDPAIYASKQLVRLLTFISTSTEADKQASRAHFTQRRWGVHFPTPQVTPVSTLFSSHPAVLRRYSTYRLPPVAFSPALHPINEIVVGLNKRPTASIHLPAHVQTTSQQHIQIPGSTRLNHRQRRTRPSKGGKCPDPCRFFHATLANHKTLLTGAIVSGVFHVTRSVITALPILWRWQLFKNYPRSMWAIAAIPVVAMIALVTLAHEKHPFTDRNRLMFIDEPTELEMAETSYTQMLARYQHKFLSSAHPDYEIVARLARNLLAVVGPVRDWRLHVVDDDNVMNALVTPTGKIFVFTGLLRVADDLDAVAAILAHELAHVLSRHGAEKMGFQYLARLGWDFVHSLLYTLTLNLPVLSDIAGRGVDATKDIISSLPYSRMCETEADLIGLFLMSIAGFNPRAAIEFWDDLSKEAAKDKSRPYEFLSDHPSHDRRAIELREHLPAALQIFHARQNIYAEFEAARARNDSDRIEGEGIGKSHYHSMDELNRTLFGVLRRYISVGKYFGSEERTLVQKSLEAMEVDHASSLKVAS